MPLDLRCDCYPFLGHLFLESILCFLFLFFECWIPSFQAVGQFITLDLSYFTYMVFRDKRHSQIAVEINIYFFLALRSGANYNPNKNNNRSSLYGGGMWKQLDLTSTRVSFPSILTTVPYSLRLKVSCTPWAPHGGFPCECTDLHADE